MARITGIGGVFVGAADPKAVADWYREKLGLDYGDYGCNLFWRDDPKKDSACSVFYHFQSDSDYFKPGHAHFMLNFRVDDLDTFLAEIKAKGVEQEGDTVVESYGKFAWVVDPWGLKIEFWEEGDAPGSEAATGEPS